MYAQILYVHIYEYTQMYASLKVLCHDIFYLFYSSKINLGLKILALMF
jgi:hypothetical protein